MAMSVMGLLLQENIQIVTPAYAVTCMKMSPFSCPIIVNFI